ncbi:zinc finger protein ZAT5-like [Phragmites australis]|uniref:zinc finger protein ZAT5-like n=1 Tax=Phragmites australis TaxID=29695 RepID=UPI002D7837D0|nr:zinc finger protein ZAT5-like [Phragmites australis]
MHKEEEEREQNKAPPLMMTTVGSGAAVVVKRKQRTKRRQRHSSLPSPASSSSRSTTTTHEEQEEEDMAKCLILLAQGAAVDSPTPQPPAPKPRNRFTSRKYADGGKAGFYVYECKTCNKCFPSFQALGGHRTSHKKPRLATHDEDVTTSTPPMETMLSLRTGDAKLQAAAWRAHECSTCGTVFASGQALGGHMRRHRPLPAAAPESVVTADDSSKLQERSVNLELDLNLPAPSTDEELTSPAPMPLGQGSLITFAHSLH